MSTRRQLVAEIGYKMRPDIQFYRGRGCAACAGTGHAGHIGVFEVVTMSEATICSPSHAKR